LASDQKLEQTINKILSQTEAELLETLKKDLDESKETLSKSLVSLEEEYDRIIDDGKKEAEKIEKQIVGSSDLESRNKQILLVDDFVKKVFDKAIDQIGSTKRDDSYSKLMATLLEEATNAIGTTDVNVYTNSKDVDVVRSQLSNFQGAELSSETIDCIGGVQVSSKDGAMTFNNTIDARLERMKPLIRKEIAGLIGIGG